MISPSIDYISTSGNVFNGLMSNTHRLYKNGTIQWTCWTIVFAYGKCSMGVGNPHPFIHSNAPGARPGSAMTSATSSLASLHEQAPAAPLPGAVRGSWASEILEFVGTFMENLWDIYGESMGTLWRIYGKFYGESMGNLWRIYGKSLKNRPYVFFLGYPLVKVNITMENLNAIHG